MLNEKRIEEIYDRLPQLVVALDPDPAGRGAPYLQDLISKVRGYLNEVGIYLQEVLRVRGGLESDLEALKSAFEISSNDLMANEAKVSNLPAVQDRIAMINVILRDEYKAILDKRKEVNDISYVEKAVRHRHRELEHTMSAIRLQRSLLQSDLGTGAFNGDENLKSRGDTWDNDPDEIAKILAEEEDEIANILGEEETSVGLEEKTAQDKINIPKKMEVKEKGISEMGADNDLADFLGAEFFEPEFSKKPEKSLEATEEKLSEKKRLPFENLTEKKEDPDVAAFLDDEFGDVFEDLDPGRCIPPHIR
jgi:hypothetical protein